MAEFLPKLTDISSGPVLMLKISTDIDTVLEPSSLFKFTRECHRTGQSNLKPVKVYF